jgi:hypothetical protein
MDIDIKTRLEALEKLRNGSWQDYDTRRTYEWKIAISIWTAFAAFIALVLTGRINTSSSLLIITIVLIDLIIIYLHGNYIRGISRALNIDRKKQFLFEGEILSILNIKIPDELMKEIDVIIKQKGKREKFAFRHWSQGLQIGVTLILSFAAVIAVYFVDG